MRMIRAVWFRLRVLLDRPALDNELDRELRDHVERESRANLARGMLPAEARRAALIAFGGMQRYKEETRDAHGGALVEDFVQDVQYAARGLMRRPGFTAVAVLTLALGVGATTAIFSAVDTLILRPLPFKDSDRLMNVNLVSPATSDGPGNANASWSYPKFLFFRDQQRVFESVTFAGPAGEVNVTGDNAERVGQEEIDAQYLPTLGVQVARGSNFPVEEDAHPGAPALAIISDRLWHRRYSADPAIVGKSIALEGRSYVIVGVTPPGFLGLSGEADILVPITVNIGTAEGLGQKLRDGTFVVARRKVSVSRDEAIRGVALLGAAVAQAFPSAAVGRAWSATARDLDVLRLAPVVRRGLVLLFGAVLLVLLIACVNLASLLLGRAHARRREIAVRLALGARRERLVRLLVTESVLLSLLGGVASIALAWGGAAALAQVNANGVLGSTRSFGGGIGVVDFSSIQLDSTALAFTFAVAIAVGLAFGLVPALQATSPVLVDSLKEGAGMAGRARGRLHLGSRQFLVVSEVALALMLLAGSGLMIRSLGNLLRIDPGFNAHNVLTLQVSVPETGYVREAIPASYMELTGRLGALPGVTDVAFADCPPLTGFCGGTRIAFSDPPPADKSQWPMVGPRWITPRWLATMHVRLLSGRAFADADRMGAPKVVLVSATAARQFWPGESPVGKKVTITMEGFTNAEVIGVVDDVREGLESPTTPDVYLPFAQAPHRDFFVFIRTAGDPAALATAARKAIWAVAPSYSVYDVQTMMARAAGATARTRYSAVVLALFAGVALLLAIVGIYGVMSFVVTQRTREVGIRMALGADRGDTLRLFLGQGFWLAGAGALLGLTGALAATRVLRTFLFGVKTWDPATYVAIVAVLGAAALVATGIPALRATRVQPTEALRHE
jgi:predicted permease